MMTCIVNELFLHHGCYSNGYEIIKMKLIERKKKRREIGGQFSLSQCSVHIHFYRCFILDI